MTDPQVELARADAAMAALHQRVQAVREAQGQAASVRGEASARDGSVRAVVDSTGVVTALTITQAAMARLSPETLAAAVVATVQSAAAQARGRMGEAFASVRDPGVLAASAAGAASLGLPRASVPEVPRTAADPTGRPDAWAATPPSAPPSPPPFAVAPGRPPVEVSEEDQGDWFFADESPR